MVIACHQSKSNEAVQTPTSTRSKRSSSTASSPPTPPPPHSKASSASPISATRRINVFKKKKKLLIALAATQTHVGPPTPQFSKKQGCSAMPQHHFPFPSITVPEAGGWLRSPCMNKATSFSFGVCMQKRDRVDVHEPGAVLPKKVNGKGEIA